MTRYVLTKNRVGELGAWAEAVTGLKGWLGGMYNPGDGMIYVSNRPVGGKKNWKGGRAAQMCASYLLGVISASERGRVLLATQGGMVAEASQGVEINPAEHAEGKRDAERAIKIARERGGRDARAVDGAGA